MKVNTAEILHRSKPKPRTRLAITDGERKTHFVIRHEVFVREQGLFQETDADEHDECALPIIGTVNDIIAGTVRVYPLDESTWVGGRLAVLKEYRTFLVGPLLVKKAMKIVKERGCTRFLAYIQPQNVRFFERLRWSSTGEELVINGVAHSVMEADLGR